MFLRKHLIGARITSIRTFDLERVFEIDFETYDDFRERCIKKLIIQVMASKSNIILTNQNNVILDCLKHISNEDIELLPSRIYKLPHNSKHSFLNISSIEEYENIIKHAINEPIDEVLSNNFIGISRSFVQSLGVSKDEIYWRIKDITSHFENICLKRNNEDYTVSLSDEKKSLDVNFFLDDFYYNKETKTIFLQKKKFLLDKISTQLKKYTKRLENINAKLVDCQDMDKYRLYGELLTANLYKFDTRSNLETVTVENYYDNQKELAIPLDKKYSLNKNAERFFKKYNKLKNTLKIVSLQKKETEIELEYIQSILFSIEDATDIAQLNDIEDEINDSSLFEVKSRTSNKKESKDNHSNPLEFNVEGFTVLVGKSNKQNDFLTLKIATRDDLWFHVQKIQGSHVILKSGGKATPESVILECAKLAVKNSKAKNSKNVAVDYCPVKNVKKPSGSKPRNGDL